MNSILYIEPTEKTPLVLLDPEKRKFQIIGVSVPEDGKVFYQPVLDWLKIYCENPIEDMEFVFNLDYFNISSSKMVLFILYKLQELKQQGKKVSIKWFYNDDELLEVGEDYEYISKLDFVFIKVLKDYLVT
jgi:SiaC family regulatory phosphoprotein